jgi:hypothetical protein
MIKIKSLVATLCLSLLPIVAHASTLDHWTRDVEQRIASAMRPGSFEPSRRPVAGLVHMKLMVAPDGRILSAEPVGRVGNDLRWSAMRVVKRLRSLPPLPGSTEAMPVSLMLGFGTSEADGKILQQQLADAKAKSQLQVATR